MLYHNNIDRQDSVEVSPAPFVYGSTLQMGDVVLPAGGFLSLKVYVDQNHMMPYRFHSVQPDGKVIIADRRGTLVGYWQTFDSTEAEQTRLKVVEKEVDEEIVREIVEDTEHPATLSYVSSLLMDMQGVLLGQVACTVDVLDLIRRVVVSNVETVFLAPNAFEFLPQCHIAMLEGYAKSFGIQSQNDAIEYHTGNLILNTNNSIARCVWIEGDTDIPVNLTNTRATLESRADDNGICSIQVNTEEALPIAGHSIVVRAALMSNLRVLMEDGKLVLRGVLNA